MNKKFCEEHGKKVMQALLSQPKLSQEDMLKQAKAQMYPGTQRKSINIRIYLEGLVKSYKAKGEKLGPVGDLLGIDLEESLSPADVAELIYERLSDLGNLPELERSLKLPATRELDLWGLISENGMPGSLD